MLEREHQPGHQKANLGLALCVPPKVQRTPLLSYCYRGASMMSIKGAWNVQIFCFTALEAEIIS